jgi:uncharacterized protein YbjT (DUF2867 family)
MRLLLIGATGRTGRHVLEHALNSGHEVTVLVRDSAKLGYLRSRVQAVEGSAADPAALERAIAGCGAVISTLAPSAPGLLAQFTRCAIDAMRRAGVRRVVVVAPPTVTAPEDRPTAVQRLMRAVFTRLKRQVVADHRSQAELLVASDLDWTVVRSVLLVDGVPRGELKVGAYGRGVGRSTSRTALARFLVETAVGGRHIRELPMVSQ